MTITYESIQEFQARGGTIRVCAERTPRVKKDSITDRGMKYIMRRSRRVVQSRRSNFETGPRGYAGMNWDGIGGQ